MAALLFANLAPSANKAELIGVFDDTHRFSRNERMKEWIDSGGKKEDWNYYFSVIYITDKTKTELTHLMSELDDGSKAYKFSEPDRASQEWQELRENGETSMTYSKAGAFISG